MEVHKDNFAELLPLVKASLEGAEFVAFDFEFTGLHCDSEAMPAFFDTLQERYGKIRRSVNSFAAPQIGLSCFGHYTPDQPTLITARTFNFDLFPGSYPGLENRCFLSSVSAIEFLSGVGFDFNKWVRRGIPHFPASDREKLDRAAKNVAPDLPRKGFKASTVEERKYVQEVVDDVLRWTNCAGVRNGDSMVVDFQTGRQRYMLHNALCDAFPLYLMVPEYGKITVYKSGNKKAKRRLLVNMERAKIERAYGFGAVMQLLRDIQPVLVGHNMLLDSAHLVRLHYGQLPEQVREFCYLFRTLTRRSFDTKLLARSTFGKWTALRSRTTVDGLLQKTSKTVDEHWSGAEALEQLHDTGFDRYRSAAEGTAGAAAAAASTDASAGLVSGHAHEAGCDAFMTGAIFMRELQMAGLWDYEAGRPQLAEVPGLPVNAACVLNSDMDRLDFDVRRHRPVTRDHVFFVTGMGSKGSWGALKGMFESHSPGPVDMRNYEGNVIVVSLVGKPSPAAEGPEAALQDERVGTASGSGAGAGTGAGAGAGAEPSSDAAPAVPPLPPASDTSVVVPPGGGSEDDNGAGGAAVASAGPESVEAPETDEGDPATATPPGDGAATADAESGADPSTAVPAEGSDVTPAATSGVEEVGDVEGGHAELELARPSAWRRRVDATKLWVKDRRSKQRAEGIELADAKKGSRDTKQWLVQTYEEYFGLTLSATGAPTAAPTPSGAAPPPAPPSGGAGVGAGAGHQGDESADSSSDSGSDDHGAGTPRKIPGSTSRGKKKNKKGGKGKGKKGKRKKHRR